MTRLFWILSLTACSSAMALTNCVGDTTVVPDAGGNDATTDVQQQKDSAADVASEAAPSCDGGLVCGSSCIDPNTDSKNCGACNNACTGAYTCSKGLCGNTVDQIARGASHLCVLLHDGSVWCRGESGEMQLGETASADGPCPSYTSSLCHAQFNKVGLAGPAQQVIAGGKESCAVVSGSLFCWGYNDAGQLGHANGYQNGSSPDKTCPGTANNECLDVPSQVTLAASVVQASTSGETICAVTTAHDAFCWGAGDHGQLGNNTDTGAFTPYKTLTGDAVEVSVGGGTNNPHVCALKTDNSVWCWGWNNYNELGHVAGTNNDSSSIYGKWNHTPVQATGLGSLTPKHVIAGENFTCVLDTNGALSCWGDNEKGIITYPPSNTTITAPTAVAGVPSLVSLSAQSSHVCGVDKTNNVWCWGETTYGSVGNGIYLLNIGTASACGYQLICFGPTKLTGITALDVQVGGGNVGSFGTYAPGAGTTSLTTTHSVLSWGEDLYEMSQAVDAGGPCNDGGQGNCYPTPVPAANMP